LVQAVGHNLPVFQSFRFLRTLNSGKRDSLGTLFVSAVSALSAEISALIRQPGQDGETSSMLSI
jgi:hypothetical protein